MKKKRCPWCREPISGNEGSCPYCGRPLKDEKAIVFRSIDTHYTEVLLRQEKRYREIMIYGSIASGVWSLIIGLLIWVAGLGGFLVPVLIAGHLIALRLSIVNEPRKFMSKKRKFFTRWICRLLVLTGGGIGYSFTTIPIVGVVPGVGTFAGVTALVHRYTMWSFRQEKDRKPLEAWEKLLLAFLIFVGIVVLVVFAAVLYGIYWLAVKLFGH